MRPTDGRTLWWAKDAAWYDREANVVLGVEFGAEGPTVIDVLSCMAKLQNAGGRVKSGYLAVTRMGHITSPERTQEIIARAAEIGALDSLVLNGLTFTARISGWKADQERSYATWRKARQRQRAKAGQVGQNGTKRD